MLHERLILITKTNTRTLLGDGLITDNLFILLDVIFNDIDVKRWTLTNVIKIQYLQFPRYLFIVLLISTSNEMTIKFITDHIKSDGLHRGKTEDCPIIYTNQQPYSNQYGRN